MWDQRYNSEQYIYGTEPNDFLREQALRSELYGLHFDLLNSSVRSVIEGTGHTGQGAVVQLVALKV